ncbi:MAG: hypothetical protein J6Y57_01020 [Lachnospiraceae bacterium]|nr:hypothetical protein [Lachnospiraceae bacterium]
MTKDGKMIYAVDFDGTLSLGRWPEVGEPNKPLFEFLIREQAAGAKVILWTNRTGGLLMGAIEYCKHRGLVFDAVNRNLPELIELYENDCRKISADVYIDDKALNPFQNHFITVPVGFVFQ